VECNGKVTVNLSWTFLVECNGKVTVLGFGGWNGWKRPESGKCWDRGVPIHYSCQGAKNRWESRGEL